MSADSVFERYEARAGGSARVRPVLDVVMPEMHGTDQLDEGQG